MERDWIRLQAALAMLSVNLRGKGLESFQPIAPRFATEMADLADDARFGRPNERLDEFVLDYNDAQKPDRKQ